MARKYAIGKIAGLAGQVVTHVMGEIKRVGEFLGFGVQFFDLTYWYSATPADIAAGAEPGSRLNVSLVNVPVSASADEIRAEIMALRKMNRDTANFGSAGSELAFGEAAG